VWVQPWSVVIVVLEQRPTFTGEYFMFSYNTEERA
jgi:hypothetical protein